MKKLRIATFLTAAFLMVGSATLMGASAQALKGGDGEINFTAKTYTETVAEARKNHKKIFVDVYAVWCGPCKALQKTTFKDPKAAAYYNKNFLNISIDIEKGEGPALAKKWGVQGLPTLLILDEKGKVLAQHTGYVDGKGLLEFARGAIR